MSSAFADFRSAVVAMKPRVALVLGSGMGPVHAKIVTSSAVSFADIPGMVAPTVSGHKGQLMLGDMAGRPILAFTGRLHYYEGNSWARVVRPVEVAAELGVRRLVLTNASGGIADRLAPGSLMALTDHREWNCPYCWRERGPEERPSPYSEDQRRALRKAAAVSGVELHEGIYLSVTGPSYETPAEIRAMRLVGADAVGMSTTREAIRGGELGLEVAAISCIANRAAGLSGTPLSHKEVLEVVAAASGRLAMLLAAYVSTNR
ncbi:MAG: purine-nucleoside phosphorylase [Gemmataceae bacterium]